MRLEIKSEIFQHLVVSSSKKHRIPGLFGNFCGTLNVVAALQGAGAGEIRGFGVCGHCYFAIGNFKISRFDEMNISTVARANYDFLNVIFFIY